MGSGTKVDDKTKARIRRIYEQERPTFKCLADRFGIHPRTVGIIVRQKK